MSNTLTSTNYLATPNDETRMTNKRLQVSRRKIATQILELTAQPSCTVLQDQINLRSNSGSAIIRSCWIARNRRKRKPFYCFFSKRPIACAWHSVLLYFVLTASNTTSRFLPFLHIRLSLWREGRGGCRGLAYEEREREGES